MEPGFPAACQGSPGLSEPKGPLTGLQLNLILAISYSPAISAMSAKRKLPSNKVLHKRYKQGIKEIHFNATDYSGVDELTGNNDSPTELQDNNILPIHWMATPQLMLPLHSYR